MKIKIYKAISYIVNYLQIQLFISLISLPLLIAWGLPISSAVLIGNIVFNPLLTIFLICSSFIFFAELLSLAKISSFFMHVLEWITSVWSWIISWSSPSWLVALEQKGIMIALLCSLLAFLIMQHKKIGTPLASVGGFSILWLLIFLYKVYFIAPQSGVFYVDCNTSKLVIIRENKKTVVIDKGCLAKASPSWIEYTFVPFLTKNFGVTQIDNFIMLKPGITIFKGLATLNEQLVVKQIYLVSWSEGQMSRSVKRALKEFYTSLTFNKTLLNRLRTNPVKYDLSALAYLKMTPNNDICKKFEESSYPLVNICYKVNEQEVFIEGFS